MSNSLERIHLLMFALNFSLNCYAFSDCSSGVPHFTLEPQDIAIFSGASFNLTCEAVGPPEPVQVLWWLGGVQEGDFRPSPSVLFVEGNF